METPYINKKVSQQTENTVNKNCVCCWWDNQPLHSRTCGPTISLTMVLVLFAVNKSVSYLPEVLQGDCIECFSQRPASPVLVCLDALVIWSNVIEAPIETVSQSESHKDEAPTHLFWYFKIRAVICVQTTNGKSLIWVWVWIKTEYYYTFCFQTKTGPIEVRASLLSLVLSLTVYLNIEMP